MAMCSPCREAGEWNKSGSIETATEFHEKCMYPKSCTCQHRVGKGHISREEGNQEQEGTRLSGEVRSAK